MSSTDNLVPLVAVGGILWLANRFYKSSKSGFGIGIGAGGGFFGVSAWDFLFGSNAEDDRKGDKEGETGYQESGADEGKGPLDEPEGTVGGKDKEPGDGNSSSSGGSGSKGSDKDGNQSGGQGSGGGVGGGSGGGVGSDQGQSTDGGVEDQGGNIGDDNGGGEDDGIFDYDPYEGQYITVDLPPPDMSEAKLGDIRLTIENLVDHGITDPGKNPEDAAKLPPELHEFDIETGGLLRFWADVTLHYHYDLPWGLLDENNKTHLPYRKLWNEILAYTAKHEWELNGGGDEIPDSPTLFASTQQPTLARRGLGDTRPDTTLLVTRNLTINPLTGKIA